MTATGLPHALRALRWSLAAALGIPAIQLVAQIALHPSGGVHRTVLLGAIGTLEALGAVLFSFHAQRRLGGWLLLSSLAVAVLFHAFTGEAPPWSFLVYATAIAVVMSATAPRTKGSAHAR